MNSQAITAVILGVGVAILLGSILGLRFPMGRQSNNQISPTPTPTATEGATIAPSTAPATVPTISQNGTPFPSPYPSATPVPAQSPVPQAPTTIDPSEQTPPVNALW